MMKKEKKFLSIVNEQSSHLLQFIGNIIEISKLQEGQTQLNISNFSLNELMKKVQKRYQTELEYLKKDRLVQLRGKFPEHDVWMGTDPEKLEYILTNLLSNAIKFTGAGEIVFGYEVKQQMIEYYVIDTGMGIAAEKQELITKTFMLSDPDISNENSGIGLGLALTSGFVKLLNGRLWIEYSNPHGTKICFRIPVKIS
ncbi:MAG: HAMP domain-containing histidine kinase [Bacteroidales bacterium]|nr:HAMP domain-containing histidine kinase [Bacteroidales bacterium]